MRALAANPKKNSAELRQYRKKWAKFEAQFAERARRAIAEGRFAQADADAARSALAIAG